MVLLAIVTLLGTLLSAVPASAAAGERYELVVQDGQYRYVIDRTENSKTWAGHCSDEVLGSTPNAVTWNDIKDLTQESTPECPELKRRLGTNTVGPGSSGPGTTTTTTPTTPATPATPAVESGDGFEWHTLSPT